MPGFARRSVLLGLIAVGVFILEGESLAASARLDHVVVQQEADTTAIHLKTLVSPRYRATFIDTPSRLVIDLEDVVFGWTGGPVAVDVPPLKQVRASQYRKNVTRVVLEFTRPATYAIREEPTGLVILVPSGARSTATPAESSRPTARRPVEQATTSAAVALDDNAATDRRSVDPPGLVRVAQAPQPPRRPPATSPPPAPAAPPAPAPASPAPAGGKLISLDFKDADVVNLLRILAAESGKNVVIADDVKGKMSITLRNVPWEQALDIILEARGLEKIERDNVIRIVTREQLTRERDAIARLQEARNKADQDKATRDAELRAKAAEAAIKEQEAQQKRLGVEAAIAEQQARGPLREETIRLAYADPDEVEKTLLGLLGITQQGGAAPSTPIVPPAGPPFSAMYGAQAAPATPATAPPPEVTGKGITIKAYKPTNSIFIRHYDKDLERIKKLIRESLDIPLPQIKIEARLTELNRTDLFDIGVQWGGAGAARDGHNVLLTRGMATGPNQTSVSAVPFDPSVVNPATNLALAGFKNPTDTNPVPTFLNTLIPAPGGTGVPLGGNLVNLPIGNAPAAALGFGIIGTRFSLNLALQALESQSKARSLSRPEIVTVENGKATISLGSEIPYATVSSAGTQVQFKEAVLKLEVTPTVIREPEGVTKIKMKVVIDDNSRGTDVPSGSAGGTLPTINKRHAETEVVVREGEILVIGGINQRSETETIRKVPLFGDIPVFGWLFKAKTRAVDPDRELVVFITPSVLKDAPRGTGPTAPTPR
jgi:type IV pilus secretin PilQ/predicted competence protein